MTSGDEEAYYNMKAWGWDCFGVSLEKYNDPDPKKFMLYKNVGSTALLPEGYSQHPLTSSLYELIVQYQ